MRLTALSAKKASFPLIVIGRVCATPSKSRQTDGAVKLPQNLLDGKLFQSRIAALSWSTAYLPFVLSG
jgi:hypothetical protein